MVDVARAELECLIAEFVASKDPWPEGRGEDYEAAWMKRSLISADVVGYAEGILGGNRPSSVRVAKFEADLAQVEAACQELDVSSIRGLLRALRRVAS